MVIYSEESPFVRADGSSEPEELRDQHYRSFEMLKVIVQVDTFLAGMIANAILGKDYDSSTRPEEKVQVVLAAVTCSVFLSAVALALVLMVCTGSKYTLAWYDPLFPIAYSVFGGVLLYVTIADAVLIAFRPAEDLDTGNYWYIVLVGMCVPMFLAGHTAVLQMVLYKFEDRQEDGAVRASL